jgi:hypothetical protein
MARWWPALDVLTTRRPRSVAHANHGYGGVKLALEKIDPDFGRKRRVGVSTIINWDCTTKNISKFCWPSFIYWYPGSFD